MLKDAGNAQGPEDMAPLGIDANLSNVESQYIADRDVYDYDYDLPGHPPLLLLPAAAAVLVVMTGRRSLHGKLVKPVSDLRQCRAGFPGRFVEAGFPFSVYIRANSSPIWFERRV